MARRQSLSKDPCPVARSVDLLGDRWVLLIVRNAFDGMRRFGDFQRDLGVAKNILSDRLHKLVDANILDTVPASDGSAYQEYVLTARGVRLFPVIVALRQWAEEVLFTDEEARSSLLGKHSAQPLATMLPHDINGQVLTWDMTTVRKVGQA
jgi:DNA-binding HxlR family transcriptional regulator